MKQFQEGQKFKVTLSSKYFDTESVIEIIKVGKRWIKYTETCEDGSSIVCVKRKDEFSEVLTPTYCKKVAEI